ncbi:TPA: hypothetical protein ACWCBB_004838, partial [Escherichia coli]
ILSLMYKSISPLDTGGASIENTSIEWNFESDLIWLYARRASPVSNGHGKRALTYNIFITNLEILHKNDR